jgi:HKD family nuclease/pterin-4a-carbinolamine dehydratase
MTINNSKMIFNVDENNSHGLLIKDLLEQTDHFECLVAFATESGLNHLDIFDFLEKAIQNGMTARITTGLSYCHTQPETLRRLFDLFDGEKSKLYIYNDYSSAYVFHPKIYAFEKKGKSTVIIGSANLTAGGFNSNYEASVLIEDNGDLIKSIKDYVDDLLDNKIIEPASNELIIKYTKNYKLKMRLDGTPKGVLKVSDDTLTLKYFQDMKNFKNGFDFINDMVNRRNNRNHSIEIIRQIASMRRTDDDNDLFTERFKELLDSFHSKIMRHNFYTMCSLEHNKIIKAIHQLVRDVDNSRDSGLTHLKIFDRSLIRFREIKYMSMSIFTEILHALDNKHFAVMNGASSQALKLLGKHSHDYSDRPTLKKIDVNIYDWFCKDLKKLVKMLNFKDYTELDSFFAFIMFTL